MSLNPSLAHFLNNLSNPNTIDAPIIIVPPAHGIVVGPSPVKKRKNMNGTETPVITSFFETFRFWDAGIIGLILLATHASASRATTHPTKAVAGASYGKAAKPRRTARMKRNRNSHLCFLLSHTCDLTAGCLIS